MTARFLEKHLKSAVQFMSYYETVVGKRVI